MKNGLFLVFEFNTSTKDVSSGISKKIYNQVKSIEKNDCKIKLYNPYENIDNKLFRIMRRCPFFGYFIKWDIDYNLMKNFDFIYIRKPWFMDVDTIIFLKKAKKVNKNIKIIMEIPTFPYDYEIETISLWPLLFKDKIYRTLLKKYIDVIATYSDDNRIFGIPTINISNGVDSDELMIFKEPAYQGDSLNIICVSNLAFWHGYDRAIQGLSNYYKKKNNKKIFLHIIGDGNELLNLKKMAKQLALEKYVIFYGKRNKNELLDIYLKCQIGFDSLGRHRSKVFYNSSLKSKEYLLKGLLVVSSVNNELDIDKPPFYLKVESNNSPIDYEAVLSFFYDNYNFNEETYIRNNIVKYGIENFEFDIVMKPINKFITEVK